MTLDSRRRRDRKRTGSVVALLNGRVVPNAYYIDGRRGVVRYWLSDMGGNIVVHPDGDRPVSMERRGHVRLTPVHA